MGLVHPSNVKAGKEWFPVVTPEEAEALVGERDFMKKGFLDLNTAITDYMGSLDQDTLVTDYPGLQELMNASASALVRWADRSCGGALLQEE